MIGLLLKITCLAAAAFNFAVQAVYFTHMLQLNAYRPERYRKWCRDHDEQLVNIKHLIPFLCVPAMWLQGKVDSVVLYGVATGVLLLTALLNLPKKAKKESGIMAGIREAERDAIIEALTAAGGNVSKAARAMGLTRQTLVYRMKKHNID